MKEKHTPPANEESKILKSKIKLKGQALKIIREERAELKRRLFLLGLKDHYETQIDIQFDPLLSSRLDCVIHLLEGEVS
jgi:hypothetical protein